MKEPLPKVTPEMWAQFTINTSGWSPEKQLALLRLLAEKWSGKCPHHPDRETYGEYGVCSECVGRAEAYYDNHPDELEE